MDAGSARRDRRAFDLLTVLSVGLPPEPSSATRARTLASERLGDSCSDDTVATVALLVTELVTNAILHARTPLRLTVETRPGVVHICVDDESNDQPTLRHYDSGAVTGRGLALVDRLASSWGVEATASGKSVWCEVPLTDVPPSLASDVPS